MPAGSKSVEGISQAYHLEWQSSLQSHEDELYNQRFHIMPTLSEEQTPFSPSGAPALPAPYISLRKHFDPEEGHTFDAMSRMETILGPHRRYVDAHREAFEAVAFY